MLTPHQIKVLKTANLNPFGYIWGANKATIRSLLRKGMISRQNLVSHYTGLLIGYQYYPTHKAWEMLDEIR